MKFNILYECDVCKRDPDDEIDIKQCFDCISYVLDYNGKILKIECIDTSHNHTYPNKGGE